MPSTALYTCSRCKKEFNFDNIRYDTAHSLVCVHCLEKQQKLQHQEKLKIEKEKLGAQELLRFICVSCRFKFSVRKGSPKTLKCPYCGKTKLMRVNKYKDENDLIKDSMNTRFDY